MISAASSFAAAVCALSLLACAEKPASRSEQDSVPVRPPAAPRSSQSNAPAQPSPVLDAQAVCARAAKTEIPAKDMPNRSELASLADCDSEALYYGLESASDFVQARRCAYAESTRGKDFVLGGPVILMMIYANGLGVAANRDLALRFVCESGGADAELEARISRVLRGDQREKLDPPLDICDDITSGYMMGVCAAHEERIDSIARNVRRSSVTAGFPRIELERVTRSASAYFDTRARNEIDLSGTGRAMFQFQEKARLEDELVNMLDRLRDSTFVPADADLSSLDDGEMTSLLTRVAHCSAMIRSERELPGAISRSGIHKTQVAWVGYRNAFGALALKVRPATPRKTWERWLSQQRLRQLRELAQGC